MIVASVKKIRIIYRLAAKNIILLNYFADMKLPFRALKNAKKNEKFFQF